MPVVDEVTKDVKTDRYLLSGAPGTADDSELTGSECRSRDGLAGLDRRGVDYFRVMRDVLSQLLPDLLYILEHGG